MKSLADVLGERVLGVPIILWLLAGGIVYYLTVHSIEHGHCPLCAAGGNDAVVPAQGQLPFGETGASLIVDYENVGNLGGLPYYEPAGLRQGSYAG